MIPVVWLKARPLCWDQHLIGRMLDHPRFTHSIDSTPDDGCVLIVPARYYRPHEIQALIDPLPWVLLILTSDEEAMFDSTTLKHPNMALWTMTPRPNNLDPRVERWLGEGFPDDTTEILGRFPQEAQDRPVDVFFAGQVTHNRRTACVAAIDALDCMAVTISSNGFAQGLDRPEYLGMMAATKIAPCPAGPATPDSFRLYEALEAGCLPIADGFTPDPDYPRGYWTLLFDGEPPFPVIGHWGDLAKEVDAALAAWPANAIRAQAWWHTYKRDTAQAIHDTIDRLAGTDTAPPAVTVIVPTSPIPSHPSTAILEATLASIREQQPDAPILLLCDGIRPEQEDRRPDYETYLRRVLWLATHEWHDVSPIIFDRHHHQAAMTRVALEQVRSPLVLFVEHDTPMFEHIDWPEISAAIITGRANLVRFHHEAHVLEVHQYLMLDATPQDVEGAPLLRTVQWSQRPHLASTGFYRTILDAYFGPDSRTMIEDRMYGVLETAWREHGEAGWAQFRTWLYAPPGGDIKRSGHLDGRAGDPKFEMEYR